MVLVLKRGPVSILKIIKGQNSVNNVRGVTVFVLCIFFVDALYLYNIS